MLKTRVQLRIRIARLRCRIFVFGLYVLIACFGGNVLHLNQTMAITCTP